MKTLLWSMGLFLVASTSASATQEKILQPHRVHIWVDAGEPFGEVEAVVETTGKDENCRIQSIRLTIAGKTYTVPENQFRNLRFPWLSTVRFQRAGHGEKAYLNLTFRLVDPNGKSDFDLPQVWIIFRQGQLEELQVVP